LPDLENERTRLDTGGPFLLLVLVRRMEIETEASDAGAAADFVVDPLSTIASEDIVNLAMNLVVSQGILTV
jgi:hypothetical protein